MCSPLGKMLCEVVFLCNKLLNPENTITFSGENARPKVRMKKYEGGDLLEQTEELKWSLSKLLQAQPTSGDKIDMLSNEAEWKQSFRDRNDFGDASPGGVAHEAGSLRMQVTTAVGVVTSPGLVDETASISACQETMSTSAISRTSRQLPRQIPAYRRRRGHPLGQSSEREA